MTDQPDPERRINWADDDWTRAVAASVAADADQNLLIRVIRGQTTEHGPREHVAINRYGHAHNLAALNRRLTPPTPEVLRRLRDALTRLGPIDPANYWPDDQEPTP